MLPPHKLQVKSRPRNRTLKQPKVAPAHCIQFCKFVIGAPGGLTISLLPRCHLRWVLEDLPGVRSRPSQVRIKTGCALIFHLTFRRDRALGKSRLASEQSQNQKDLQARLPRDTFLASIPKGVTTRTPRYDSRPRPTRHTNSQGLFRNLPFLVHHDFTPPPSHSHPPPTWSQPCQSRDYTTPEAGKNAVTATCQTAPDLGLSRTDDP